jgi:hypothetical protein
MVQSFPGRTAKAKRSSSGLSYFSGETSGPPPLKERLAGGLPKERQLQVTDIRINPKIGGDYEFFDQSSSFR